MGLTREDITKMLRESFIPETSDDTETETGEREYADIQKALNINKIFTKARVMQAAGLGDAEDATDRSLFGKKLNKEKNKEGGKYSFDREEQAKIRKVIANPKAFSAK